MLFSTLMILLLTALFIIVNYKNRLYFALSIYFLSIAALILTATMYTSKLADYPYSFNMDYSIFLLLSRVRISYMLLYRLYIISISLFMFSPIFFYKLLQKQRIWKVLLFSVPALLFIIINDPELSWHLYILVNTLDGFALSAAKSAGRLFRVLNNITFFFYMFIPIMLLVRYYRRSIIRVKRQSALLFIIFLSVIDIMIYLPLLNICFSAINFNNVDLTKFPTQDIFLGGYIYTTLITIAIIILIFLLTVVYRPFRNFTILRQSDIVKNNNILNKNLKTTLHAYKNAFLGIERLAEITVEHLNNNEKEEAIASLNVIMSTSGKYSDRTLSILHSLRNLNTESGITNVVKCIENALENFRQYSQIRFSVSVNTEDILIICNEAHLCEVFVNLFQNAVNAINKKNKSGNVSVNVMSEDDYIVIDVTDDGIGISKEDRKRVFAPFYTTKLTGESCGLGLTYVERVVKMYNGNIEVIGDTEVGTTFRIVLPLIIRKLIGRERI